jgi:hypothetical protein
LRIRFHGTSGVEDSGDRPTITFVTDGDYSTNVRTGLDRLTDKKTRRPFSLMRKYTPHVSDKVEQVWCNGRECGEGAE